MHTFQTYRMYSSKRNDVNYGLWRVKMYRCIFTDFFLRFYLFMRDTQREAETQAEGEAGSMQGA